MNKKGTVERGTEKERGEGGRERGHLIYYIGQSRQRGKCNTSFQQGLGGGGEREKKFYK